MEQIVETIDGIEVFNDKDLYIPIPQKLLKAGFKPITNQDMRTRFSCDAIQEKANNDLMKQLESEGYYNVHLYDSKVDAEEAVLSPMFSPMYSYDIFSSMYTYLNNMTHRDDIIGYKKEIDQEAPFFLSKEKEEKYYFKQFKCRVDTKNLDSYTKEEIPDRCLASVKRALDLGCDKDNIFLKTIESFK